MFEVEVCESPRVVLVRFRGQLTEEDFGGLDRLASESRGKVAYDCIFDMTAIDRVELSTDFVAQRGDLPQAYNDRERIYVVPQDDLKLLVRFYAASQAAKGWKAPEVVRTLDEAFSRLGVTASDFRVI